MSLLLGKLFVVSLTCCALFAPLYAMATDQEESLLFPQDIGLEPALVPRMWSEASTWALGNMVAENQSGSGHVHSQSLDVEEYCSDPAHPEPKYNSSCEYVLRECSVKAHLINYLEIVYCKMPHLKALGVVLLSLWITYLISLLATTVDFFFVPPLNFLADKLKLSPGIAGITLLAVGNAAPDIFVVYSGMAQNDLGLVLGSLGGGAIFITTIVLATIIVVSNTREYKLDKFDIMRDILAITIIISVIVAVACDGVVHLYEACILPTFYVIYIVMAISIGCVRDWRLKRSRSDSLEPLEETTNWDQERTTLDVPSHDQRTISIEGSLPLKRIEKILQSTRPRPESIPLIVLDDTAAKRTVLPGLTWPTGAHFLVKFIWFVQWPFTLLRWLTVPPFCHVISYVVTMDPFPQGSKDGCWSRWHYCFAVISPIPMSLLVLLSVKGWEGFIMYVWKIPLPALLVMIGFLLSVPMAFLLKPRTPPNWAMQLLLVPAAFIIAIVWLNIIASEVVSVLQSVGLILSIDTAILALTILAIGNSVADWVADTVVAKYGKVEMAFASCFGSPLMSHVLGLSISLIIRLTIYNHGEPYRFNIHTPNHAQVKVAWLFLGVSLISSLILFPVFKFSPPRLYSLVLLCGYLTFVVTAILTEVGILPILL